MASALRVGTSASSLQDVPNPTDISISINDISSADAGRTNDASVTMHKNRITSKRTLALTWKNISGTRAQQVLSAFAPEYFYVRYFDPQENAFVTKQFYAGDKSTGVSHYHLNSSYSIGGVVYKTISFNIIER